MTFVNKVLSFFLTLSEVEIYSFFLCLGVSQTFINVMLNYTGTYKSC